MFYLFKFQKLKESAIFKIDPFSKFFTFFNMFLILKNLLRGLTIIKNSKKIFFH